MRAFVRVAIGAAIALAPSAPTRADEPTEPSEPTAADVAGAPTPGDESGRTDPGADAREESAARLVARGVLAIPRIAFTIAMAPVRGGVYAYDQYHVKDRWYRVFFDDTGDIGLYPTARFEAGFGVNVGARFVHRDLAGRRERVALFAGTGGRFRHKVGVALRSGDRFGDRLALATDAEFERRPKDPFYGVGNDASGLEARFRQQLMRVAAVADVRIAGDLHALAAGALTDVELSVSDTGEPIDMLYAPADLVGWPSVRHGYGELELRWDGRDHVGDWDLESITSTGSLAAVFAGRVARLDGGTDFWRYGVDLQHFMRLGIGPRFLLVRGHAEAVSRGRDEVAFTELPQLGGKTLLRGYARDRFRDRVAAAASVEYQWDLLRPIAASVFVDAGRVYPSLAAVTVADLRVGYGLGVHWFSQHALRVRASIASSIHGGLFFDVAFDPVTELDARVEQR